MRINLKYTIVLFLFFNTINIFGYTIDNACLVSFQNDTKQVFTEYCDSNWQTSSFTEPQYNKKSNFISYRSPFLIKSDLYKSKDSLFLFLGPINGADETYLNGEKIGSNGNFPPNFLPDPDLHRIYYIPFGLLKKDNLLIIKVYSEFYNIFYSQPVIYTAKELKKFRQSHINIKQSAFHLPFSNGISIATYNLKDIRFGHFYPHLYKDYDKSTPSKLLIKYAKPIIYNKKEEINLQTLTTIQTGYIEGTGIIKHVLKADDYQLSIFGFCPFSETKPIWIFFIVLEGANLDDYSLNFDINISDSTTLSIQKEAFKNEGKKWLRAIVYYDDKNSSNFHLNRYKNKHTGFLLLTDEMEWWQNWHKQTLYPEFKNYDAKRLYIQSLATLKMAQCREEFPANGQIISTLFPGNNNSTRLIDQTYATDAFLASGHYKEALNSLQFLMHGRCGKYKNFEWYGKNYGLLNDYALSISSYYGNGTEKSVHNQNGPIISISGFGLTLSNLKTYIQKTDDIKFLEYYWQKISRNIANVLTTSIDETGLIRADSGPWNSHLPGKHFTYSSACIYRGLIDAAWMARLLNKEINAQEYEYFANKIQINIEEKLFDKQQNILRGSLEGRTKESYIDGSGIEIINWIYTPQDKISSASLRTIEKYLTISENKKLYRQNLANEWSNRQASIFLNLRLITAYNRMNKIKKVNEIKKIILKQAKINNYLIPEYYDEYFFNFVGQSPMCGRGAGAYILSTWSQ